MFPRMLLPVLLMAFFPNPHPQASSSTSASTPSSATHSMGTRRTVEGLPNFGEVTSTLYRGGQPTHKGIEQLAKMGVKVVVDLRGGGTNDEKAAVSKLGMQFVSIPSHCPFPHDEPFARFLRVIRDNPGMKVFVHCRLGDDRTGMAVAAYRMSEEGWSADEAMKEMKSFGFSSAHHAICPGLADYEKSFPERLKKNPAFEAVRSESKR